MVKNKQEKLLYILHNKLALPLIILLLSLLCQLYLDQGGTAHYERDVSGSVSGSDGIQLMDKLRTELSSFKKLNSVSNLNIALH